MRSSKAMMVPGEGSIRITRWRFSFGGDPVDTCFSIMLYLTTTWLIYFFLMR
jgi:hypothetical protein